MLVASPTSAMATANDSIEVNANESSMAIAVAETASARASTPYPAMRGTSIKVAKRDIPNTKNNISMSWLVSDASLMYAGSTASTTPKVIA